MKSDLSSISDIVIVASTAVFIVTLFLRMKISPVLGYFVAGASIGSHGLGIVHEYGMMEAFAEFGIVFLLFLIGLELTFERLIAMRIHVFGFGTLQVIVTSIVIWCACYAYGISPKGSAIIGGALALSSTAIVLQVLKDNNKDSSLVGRLAIAILLLQDFAVVPLLVFVQIIDSGSSSDSSVLILLLNSLLKASVALIVIFITGRILLRPVFNAIVSTKSRELFIATTLLIILLAAYSTESLDLSMELGAFVAGLLVAETEYRHEVEQVVLPFKGLLLGLFFMTVGMSIDLKILINEFATIIVMASSLIIIKSSIIVLLCYIFKFRLGDAINSGLLLSQGGEFAFILFGMEGTKEVLGDYNSQIFMIVVTVTMAVTPLLYSIGQKAAVKIDGEKDTLLPKDSDLKDLDHHIIIGGFGRVGKIVASLFAMQKINCIAVDTDAQNVQKGRDEGKTVYLGNIGKLDTLKSVGLERCKAIIIAIKNETTVLRCIKVIRSNFPNVKIVVRVYDINQIHLCKELGASHMVSDTCETALELASETLESMGYNNSTIESLRINFKKNLELQNNNNT